MAKQQPLSPEKYITTKARTLPIYKCYVTSDWKEVKMVSVLVMRQHVNGKVTVGLYLVDLFCLGVKDTFYAFNITEEEAEERFNVPLLDLVEVDYNLAHNIVYAGHDFALEFDIKPHKDFNITKYILEEDTEKIPVIEIPVGDENGNPSLVVAPSYNYGPALQKLKQHAGEGNYTFTIRDEFDFDDSDEDEDEDFDEDDEINYEDFIDEDDELEDDDDENIDFHIVSDMETEELEEIIEEQSESFSNQLIVLTELLLRKLNEVENGVLEDLDKLKEKKDYRLFEKKKEQWEKSVDDTNEKLQNMYPLLQSIGMNPNELSHKALMAEAVELLNKHITDDITAFMIVNSIPLLTILSEIKTLEDNFDKYTPSVQIFIATYIALRVKEPAAKYHFLLNAAHVEMAYPFNRYVHAFHHKLFWLLQAVHAIQQNDKEKIFHYHNLVRTNGAGGHLKFLYAAQLETWLKGYMNLQDEDEEDEVDEDDSLDYEMVDDDK